MDFKNVAPLFNPLGLNLPPVIEVVTFDMIGTMLSWDTATGDYKKLNTDLAEFYVFLQKIKAAAVLASTDPFGVMRKLDSMNPPPEILGNYRRDLKSKRDVFAFIKKENIPTLSIDDEPSSISGASAIIDPRNEALVRYLRERTYLNVPGF